MRGNKDSAERLFVAIGNIGDDLVHEASAPFRSAKRKVARTLLIAAVISLSLTVLFGLSILSRSSRRADTVTYQSVFEYLEENEASFASYKEDQIDLFSGTPSIIWKKYGGEDYHSVPLSKTGLAQLMNETDQAETAGENPDLPSYLVWICDGKGNVYSPFIDNTPGNTGYGVLFDYLTEVIPSGELENSLVSYIEKERTK